ncbi:MAG TPA: virulence factor MviN [Firmicutes bacterium]|nr:virulence factor MviN [Bacillota bacterium]
MSQKITLLNMFSGLVLQIFTLINGFILPKIILSFFGSEVNGLVSSINQFLSYIALVEGGITGVVTAAFYNPLVKKDEEKISSILVTADYFYRKIGIFFIVYSIFLSIVYPLLFAKSFDFTYVCPLILILAFGLLIQYMFSLTFKTLLTADKRIYIVNFIQTVIICANILLVFLSVYIYPSIHVLKLISSLLFIFQPIYLTIYVRKRYRLNRKAKLDNSLLKSRWNGFAINFAAFIHSSTDIVILTLFTNLKVVSVYSIYYLVVNGIKQLINSCLSGLSATVGQAYVKKDLEELNQKLDIYEYIVFILVFFFFTVAALLITPFVQLYTSGVSDINYNQPVFGLLLVISEALYIIKFPHLDLAYSANKFKEITLPAYIEAFFNIVISILMVGKFGLIGVTIGTIVGMIYRLIFQVFYTSKLIEGRRQGLFYKKLLLFTFCALIGFCICKFFIPFVKLSILSWLKYAVIYSFVICVMLFLLSLICFKSEMKFFINYLNR